MKIKYYFLKVLFTFLILLSFANYAEALSVDPFEYFNVYSLGDIGQSTDKYNTDVEGTIGAAGNVYFENFGAPNLGSSEYVLHTGGDFYIKSGSMQGKIDVGGDFSIENYQVTHDVHVGGKATLPQSTSGASTATLRAAGTIDQYQWNNINAVSGAYDALLDFNALNKHFKDTSTAISAMQPTGVAVFNGCSIILNASSGVNVFNIDATALDNSCNTIINGEPDSIVYINAINADSASLTGSTPWSYNGVSESNVLLNYASSTTELTITSGMIINILAPYADTLFTSGLVDGNLITGNLYGGAQVNFGHFNNPSQPIPEPSTFILLGSAMAGLFGFRKRFRKQV